MQARFYAPWYGRFLSPDPARDQHFEETQSWNIYSYCMNNPTMLTDPSGMFIKELLQGVKNVVQYHKFKTDAQMKVFFENHARANMGEPTVPVPSFFNSSDKQTMQSVKQDAQQMADQTTAGKLIKLHPVKDLQRRNQGSEEHQAEKTREATNDALGFGVDLAGQVLDKVAPPGSKTAADVLQHAHDAATGDKKGQQELKKDGKKAVQKQAVKVLKKTVTGG